MFSFLRRGERQEAAIAITDRSVGFFPIEKNIGSCNSKRKFSAKNKWLETIRIIRISASLFLSLSCFFSSSW